VAWWAILEQIIIAAISIRSRRCAIPHFRLTADAQDRRGHTLQLLETARAELEWLCAIGWVESRTRDVSSRFLLQYASATGTLTLAPSSPGAFSTWSWPRSTFRAISTRGCGSLLRVRGLPELSPGLDVSSVQAAKAGVARAAAALELLRETELAGDWSRFATREPKPASTAKRQSTA
jgi:hypothetical protein